jgi:serine/threonine-protein kinase
MAHPQKLGRYQIETKLGQGGMGSVFRARDPVLERAVAIKTLGGAFGLPGEHRAEFLERFQREARAAGRLSHPNIVGVHDLGVDEATDTPFIVMEYVPGVSLATVLKENPALPVAQALEIVEQIGAALEEAHRHGVVHRDIKPANVFLDDRGRVKVGDFGIARVEDSELTQTGVGLGTPGYIAPEVLRGGRADARSDLFALGVLAYALLAGKKPFPGETRETLAIQVLEHQPEPPATLRPEAPRAASDAVMRALAKRPDDRQPDVAAFLRELRGGPETLPRVAATRTITPAPAPRRRFGLIAVALLVLLLLAGIAALVALQRGETEAALDPSPTSVATPRPKPTARPAAATTTTQPEQPLFTVTIPLPGGGDAKPPSKGKGRGRGQDKKKERD